MAPRESWDEYFMNQAYFVASRATCPRLQVGVVVVKNNRILATGYNGAPVGEPHCIDEGVGCLMIDGSCKRTIHGEINAITHLSRMQRAGSTIYCTDTPCMNCAEVMTRSGIVQWVFARNYRDYEAKIRPLFEWHGIVFRQYIPNMLRELVA